MNAYTISLFLHIASDIGLMIGIGLWLVAYSALRRADRVEQVRAITGIMFLSKAFYAITGLLLLGSGIYMTVTVWGFDTAWIDVALGTLFVLILPVGPLFAEPRMKAIAHTAIDSPDGALPTELQAQIQAPMLGTSLYVMMAASLGIVFLMSVKPSLAIALIAIAAFVVTGAAFSLPLWMADRARSSRSAS